MSGRPAAVPFALFAALAALIAFMTDLEPLFRAAFPELDVHVYRRDTFLNLTLQHVLLVGLSSAVSIVAGVGAGLFATRPAGREFEPIISSLAAIGQTFPPAAILAVVVPMVGFGFAPTLLALTLYGVLPIVQNTIVGIRGVPAAVLESASGTGMTRLHVLTMVELPLAMPVIIAGVRVSVIINIGTATIGATVGARGLGTPIIAGLVGDNIAYVIQGAFLVGLLAVLTDTLLERVERAFRYR